MRRRRRKSLIETEAGKELWRMTGTDRLDGTPDLMSSDDRQPRRNDRSVGYQGAGHLRARRRDPAMDRAEPRRGQKVEMRSNRQQKH